MRTTGFIFFTLSALLVLASCSKDKEEENAPLAGRWEMSSQRADVETNNELFDKEIKSAYEANSAQIVLNFWENNKVTITDRHGLREYFYSTEGNKLTLTHVSLSNVVLNLEYSISGKTLTIYDDITETYQRYAKEYEWLDIYKVVIVQKYVK